MGLLNILGKVAGGVLSQVQNALNDQNTEPQRTAAPQAPRQAAGPGPAVSDWPAYFAEILATEFPFYTVRQQVPVTEMTGFVSDTFKLYKKRPAQVYKAEWGAPYTFVMYQGAAPRAIVMLGSGRSHDSNVKYLISRMYAKKMGLPYINFYTQMPNERGYVIQRINSFLVA